MIPLSGPGLKGGSFFSVIPDKNHFFEVLQLSQKGLNF
jgi:hypothetical protein